MRKRFFFIPSLLLMISVLVTSCREEVRDSSEPSLIGVSAPEFPPQLTWLNVDTSLSFLRLKGQPILLYFWSSTSINAERAIRQVNLWHRRYRDLGLSVVGVHAPQFSFEKDLEHVKNSVSRVMILHPVVLDNDFDVWNAFLNRAWPTFYLIDSDYIIRDMFVGETEYERIETRIQELLAEGDVDIPDTLEIVAQETDFSRIGTPQIQVGYDELSHFGSPEPVLTDAVQTYTATATLQFNHFYLVGEWEIQSEKALLRGSAGKLLLRFEASRAHIVLGSIHGERLRAEVRLNGQPLTVSNYGRDIWFRDGRSYVEIDARRLYELVNTRGIYDEYTLEISFLLPDIEVYSFMFG